MLKFLIALSLLFAGDLHAGHCAVETVAYPASVQYEGIANYLRAFENRHPGSIRSFARTVGDIEIQVTLIEAPHRRFNHTRLDVASWVNESIPVDDMRTWPSANPLAAETNYQPSDHSRALWQLAKASALLGMSTTALIPVGGIALAFMWDELATPLRLTLGIGSTVASGMGLSLGFLPFRLGASELQTGIHRLLASLRMGDAVPDVLSQQGYRISQRVAESPPNTEILRNFQLLVVVPYGTADRFAAGLRQGSEESDAPSQ